MVDGRARSGRNRFNRVAPPRAQSDTPYSRPQGASLKVSPPPSTFASAVWGSRSTARSRFSRRTVSRWSTGTSSGAPISTTFPAHSARPFPLASNGVSYQEPALPVRPDEATPNQPCGSCSLLPVSGCCATASAPRAEPLHRARCRARDENKYVCVITIAQFGTITYALFGVRELRGIIRVRTRGKNKYA